MALPKPFDLKHVSVSGQSGCRDALQRPVKECQHPR